MAPSRTTRRATLYGAGIMLLVVGLPGAAGRAEADRGGADQAAVSQPAVSQPTGHVIPSSLSFNRDIRPILSEHCFACHGPDAAGRKADLRLDDRTAALQAQAIVPGDAAASLLIERILSDDPELVMPPPEVKKPLAAESKQKLQAWIAAGAPYEKHWAFLPVPNQVPIPGSPDPLAWQRQPIDAFVYQQLRDSGEQPAAPAPRETWLRRVTFDLTGLPPTVAELDDFLGDRSSDAEERVVDRLLRSPTYGERMANDWLDVARFADTYGYQADRDMHVWPWRDWCIRAFNENLPYDQFITWQTAGDLLPNATSDQLTATTFNRLHRQTNEGGSIEEEFRTAYIADRVVTNGTAFLGLTLDCARCHDHKFDPISQRDFYALASFFGNIDEHGLYSHFTETAPTPAMLLYGPTQQQQHDELRRRIQAQELALQQAAAAGRERFATWEPTAPPQWATLQNQAKWEYKFEEFAATDDYQGAPGHRGQGIRFSGDGAYTCAGAGPFDRTTPFSFAVWVRPIDHAARRVIFHRSVAAEDASFRGYSLVLDQGHVKFSLIHFWPGNAIQVASTTKLPLESWTHITITYDGSSRADGIHLYLDGVAAPSTVLRDQLTRDITYRGDWGDSGGAELSLGARFRDVGFAGGTLDDLLVFDRELSGAEVADLHQRPATAEQRLQHYLLNFDGEYQRIARELEALRREENAFNAGIRQLMVLREAQVPRQLHVLKRGAYDAPGEAVDAHTPAEISPFPSHMPRNRLGLAAWMTANDNPLVSRVAVNRFWNIFFGRGLVASLGDFGSQGSPPTHPALLDWLARDFMDHGWDVKRLCKQIALSATYRQASTPHNPQRLVDDPDNVLLARGPRHRLSAEQLRDNALMVSALLDPTLGGPSVFPYQPAGLWEESGTGRSYTPSSGAGLYRRSLYSFWRRTSPPPSMITFDATSREVCTARRERTNTPLQALVLQNDPQFVEAARVLAERLLQDHSDPRARIRQAFRQLTSRTPSEPELELMHQLYTDQCEAFGKTPQQALELLAVGQSPRAETLDPVAHAATTLVVQTLMNFDECITKR